MTFGHLKGQESCSFFGKTLRQHLARCEISVITTSTSTSLHLSSGTLNVPNSNTVSTCLIHLYIQWLLPAVRWCVLLRKVPYWLKRPRSISVAARIRALQILYMPRKGASMPLLISFSIGYTGPSFRKGKEIIPSQNSLRQEHFKGCTIRPFYEKTTIKMSNYFHTIIQIVIYVHKYEWTRVWADFLSVLCLVALSNYYISIPIVVIKYNFSRCAHVHIAWVKTVQS